MSAERGPKLAKIQVLLRERALDALLTCMLVCQTLSTKPKEINRSHSAAALKAVVMVVDIARTTWLAPQIGVPEEISLEDVAKLHHRYAHIYSQQPGADCCTYA